jgi:DNA-binding transcriptional LysR family regulator
MYNRHLKTFIQVADSGSFMKAAEAMYISANAVTKQINLLESHLNLKLFERSTQGLILTDSGKLIYSEAKKLIRHSDSVLRKAQELEQQKPAVIRVGVSLMNPVNLLMRQWTKASEKYPNMKLEVVPFEDTVDRFNQILDNLGKTVDLIPCPYQNDYWGDRYNSFHLMDLPVCVSFARTHPLAEKTKLTMEDLHGENLILKKNVCYPNGRRLYDDFMERHPQIHLVDVDYYEFNTFNQIVSNNSFILSAECWSNVHPLLTTVPLELDYRVPYGLIYSKEPSKEVLQFIMALGQVN